MRGLTKSDWLSFNVGICLFHGYSIALIICFDEWENEKQSEATANDDEEDGQQIAAEFCHLRIFNAQIFY